MNIGRRRKTSGSESMNNLLQHSKQHEQCQLLILQVPQGQMQAQTDSVHARVYAHQVWKISIICKQICLNFALKRDIKFIGQDSK